MLKSLSVRNVVLIDALNLDFNGGLSVFSGETGAGKSILLDSLGLLLGNRAELGLIRSGADKLTVSGVFELADKNNPFFAICAENDMVRVVETGIENRDYHAASVVALIA